MPPFRLSQRAEGDLFSIAAYTLHTWGERQALRYLNELEACCRALAENPSLGRSCDHIRPGLYRIERGRHVVFYRQQDQGILVVRILHQRMLPGEHKLEDEDTL